jgi:hypothetical protein
MRLAGRPDEIKEPLALDPHGPQLGGALNDATRPVDLRHAAGTFAVLLIVHRHARAAAHFADAHGALLEELLARVAVHVERVGGGAVTAGRVERLDLRGLRRHHRYDRHQQHHRRARRHAAAC